MFFAQNLRIISILPLTCRAGPPRRTEALPLICLVLAYHAKPSVQQVQVTLSLTHQAKEAPHETYGRK